MNRPLCLSALTWPGPAAPASRVFIEALPAAGLCALACGAAAAQTPEAAAAAIITNTNTNTNTNATNATTTDWAAFNRCAGLALGLQRQHYREADTAGRTPDGILDAERGALQHTQIELRWQAGPAHPTPESAPHTAPHNTPQAQPWLAASVQRATGATGYRGYLQQGSGQLTPYRSQTGNEDWQYQIKLGLALPQGPNWQIVPYVGAQHRRWRRDLSQYREHFGHTAALAGLLAQWQIEPRWTVELEGAWGRTVQARMAAPQLAFDQPLGQASLWQAGAQISYLLNTRWSLNASVQHQQWRHGASPVQNGLQEPPGRTRQTAYGVGVAYHY